MTPEEARILVDLRQRVLANKREGNPPETGITKEELKEALSLCRKDYTSAQAKSKASGVNSPSAPGPVIDIDALFTDKKSG